jgi:hypothetical protein
VDNGRGRCDTSDGTSGRFAPTHFSLSGVEFVPDPRLGPLSSTGYGRIASVSPILWRPGNART